MTDDRIVHEDKGYLKPFDWTPEGQAMTDAVGEAILDAMAAHATELAAAAKANPWANPNHDVMADIREFKQRAYDASPYGKQIQPKGNEVQSTLLQEGLQRLEEVADFSGPIYRRPDSAAIVSGGLDSITLVYHMLTEGYTPHLLSFDYGQRHNKELQFAALTARNLRLRHNIIDLTGIGQLISNSALTSPREAVVINEHPEHVGWKQTATHYDVEVPDGHYAEETMKATVVPNRNMIMLSIAAGVAVNNSYKRIAIGVHGGDHFIYPDCRPRFINAAVATIVAGNQGFGAVPEWPEGGPLEEQVDFLYAPFLHSTKADIAYRALELNVPLHMTWSCYKGGDKHCGRCGTCVERLEAIDAAVKRANMKYGHHHAVSEVDQTEYEDNEFWKQAVRGKA